MTAVTVKTQAELAAALVAVLLLIAVVVVVKGLVSRG